MFFYNGLHFIPMALHVAHQFELRAAAIQVVAFAMNFKIVISLQIVGQETNSAFKSHQFGTPDQRIFFQVGQGIASGSEESFGIGLKKRQAEVYLGQIPLVFSTVVGAKSDVYKRQISKNCWPAAVPAPSRLPLCWISPAAARWICRLTMWASPCRMS